MTIWKRAEVHMKIIYMYWKWKWVYIKRRSTYSTLTSIEVKAITP